MLKRTLFAAAAAMALLAATPQPFPTPNITLPSKPLHATFEVQVNHLGQVVRVIHGSFSGEPAFDTMTLGNAMQMWIRHPDGSAETGLYRVRYDYDPRKKTISRAPSLVSAGGSWADSPGAATRIIIDARRLAQAEYQRLKAEEQKQQAERAKHLPDINAAVKRAVVKPSPTTHP